MSLKIEAVQAINKLIQAHTKGLEKRIEDLELEVTKLREELESIEIVDDDEDGEEETAEPQILGGFDETED